MASQAPTNVSTTPCRNEICVKLWELHRCNGSSPGVGRWNLVDGGFLNSFVAQFEQARQCVGSSEEEVLEAIASIKKATADARKSGNKTKPDLSTSGISSIYCGLRRMVGLM